MKITMYELLGMIKEGKAPKKVIFDGIIWKFEEDNLYYSDSVWLDGYCNISQSLNDEVEIIESQEHKIPEKLDYKYENIYHNISKCKHSEIRIIDKINEILDYLEEIE